jgi:hypothetical protein
MNMTNMGRKLDEPTATNDGDEIYYPSLYLDQKQMKALGLSRTEVGCKMQMIAQVRVRSISDSARAGGSIDIEILEAAFQEIPKKKDRASILYGDD